MDSAVAEHPSPFNLIIHKITIANFMTISTYS